MDFWTNIFDKIAIPSVKIVYIAIGCCMENYTEITKTNNQQYPCFLNKFDRKKVIILIDPFLEKDLKIQEPLILVNNENKNIRFFENDNLFVFAINQSFNYEFENDIAIICKIIEICFNKINKAKIILQDYTGRDTTMFYTSLFNIFNKKELLNNVLFDVTQNNGGCLIELFETMAPTDALDNFIQYKYLPLHEIHDYPQLDVLIKFRIDNLCYPLVYYYTDMPEFNKFHIEQIKLLSIIYSIDHDDNNLIFFKNIIFAIIQDIVQLRKLNSMDHKYLLDNIHNRSIFNQTMSILKFN